MKVRSPIVTLIAGVLLAAIVTFLSVRAHDAATHPTPNQPTLIPYGAPTMAVSR
jgi:hypothetical protein